jgi:hypothetical protein
VNILIIKSGVSARMSITAYENLLSTAERRACKQEQIKQFVYRTLWNYSSNWEK